MPMCVLTHVRRGTRHRETRQLHKLSSEQLAVGHAAREGEREREREQITTLCKDAKRMQTITALCKDARSAQRYANRQTRQMHELSSEQIAVGHAAREGERVRLEL